jgi:superfamily II DNA/RNA helicase
MYLDDDDYDNNNLSDQYDSNDDTPKKKSSNKNKKRSCELFSLYGNMDQHKRSEILKQFCKATSGVLVCTDVAARGLDMPNIDWIVQYNTPGTCVDYIHRVGRAARVGHKGKAVIFIEPCEIEYLQELNKLSIGLKEIKLETTMNCLNQEAKYYPRQINSDRLIFTKNAEECANSIQFYIEEYVEKTEATKILARKAYLSFMRFYACYSHEWKKIFHLKNLHIGHVAKSFGIRESPKNVIKHSEHSKYEALDQTAKQERLSSFEIGRLKPRTRTTKAMDGARIINEKSTYDGANSGGYYDDNVFDDKLGSKYARDLKRITHGHTEYGNVAKKKKVQSQKAGLDLT